MSTTDDDKPSGDPTKIPIGVLIRSMTAIQFWGLLTFLCGLVGIGYQANTWVTTEKMERLKVRLTDLETLNAQYEAKDAVLRKWYLYQLAKEKAERSETTRRFRSELVARLQTASDQVSKDIATSLAATQKDSEQWSKEINDKAKTAHDLTVTVREWDTKGDSGPRLIKVTRGTDGTATVEFLCGGPPLLVPEEFTPEAKKPARIW